MPQCIEAVLFDMDGLMFDTERLSDIVWEQAGKAHGCTIGPEEMALMRGTNREEGKRAMLAHMGADFPFDLLHEEAHAMMREHLKDSVPVRPGLHELLNFLEQHGVLMAVASSTAQALVEEYLERAGVRRFFKAVVCGDMVTRSKPAPDIYLEAARCLGVCPERCLVLEDSYNGVRAGAAAGCETLMIPDLSPATDEMRRLTSAVLPSLSDVCNYLEGRTQTSLN